MIAGGDEIGRTQRGNNNGYCQDNETTWYDWALDDDRRAMLAFTRKLIALRREHPALRRAKFFKGRKIYGTDARDLLWFTFDGRAMNDGDWNNEWAKSLMMFLGGHGLDATSPLGEPVTDDDLILLVNGDHEALEFTLPEVGDPGGAWELLIDTSNDEPTESVDRKRGWRVEARSLKLLRRVAGSRPTNEARGS
jgi:glycogen operon protein